MNNFENTINAATKLLKEFGISNPELAASNMVNSAVAATLLQDCGKIVVKGPGFNGSGNKWFPQGLSYYETEAADGLKIFVENDRGKYSGKINEKKIDSGLASSLATWLRHEAVQRGEAAFQATLRGEFKGTRKAGRHYGVNLHWVHAARDENREGQQ